MKNKRYTAAFRKAVKTDSSDFKYVTTEKDCHRWFNILNQELFSDILSKPTSIDIRRRQGTWAYVDHTYKIDNAEKKTIRLKLAMNNHYKNFKMFLNVLVHEMCHIYQAQYNLPMGHGESFREWKDIFAKRGLTLLEDY